MSKFIHQLKIVQEPLSTLDVSNKQVTTTDLVLAGFHKDGGFFVIEWLANYRLIANEQECRKCHFPMSIKMNKNLTDGFLWECVDQKCRARITLRHGSFFSNSHLPLWKIVRLIHLWSSDTSRITIMFELDISSQTATDWLNFVRDTCCKYVCDWNYVYGIGGPGKIVEIDESLFFKRKYNCGKLRGQTWIFGGVERGNSENCFFLAVPDQKRVTLLTAIKEHILPGTTIIVGRVFFDSSLKRL